MIPEKILKFKKQLFYIFGLTREKFLLNIIRCGIYLSLITPLIFSKYFFPPPFSPNIFFRLVVDIILIAYIVLFISNPNYRPKFNILTIVVSLFIGIIILTSFTGINFEKSLWGSFNRMGGVITFIHFFGFFIILSSVFKDRKDWERIFSFSILVGVLVIFLILFSSQFSIKEGGTLWNSSFLASYLLFNIYFALILFLIKRGIWRIFYGVSMVVLLSALFLSGCSGAIVSFFISLFLLALGYCIFLKRKLLKWFIFGILLVFIIFSSILLFTKSNFIKNESKIILENYSLQARFIIWKISWEGWKEKFLFGWGPENFDLVSSKYFNPELAMAKYGSKAVFDRAHNIILDIGVTSGIIGVLSYLTIFITIFFNLFKKQKEYLKKDESVLFLGLAVLLIVYFIQNLLVFDTVNSYIMFFLTLAFVNYILDKKRSKEFDGKEISKKCIYSWIGVILIISVILMTYFGDIQPARASFYINKALNTTLKESIPLFQKSFRIHLMSQLNGSKYFYSKVIQSLYGPVMDREVIKNELKIVEEELEKNIKKNPLDFYSYLQLADIYNNSFQFTRDGRKLILAESTLREAIFLSPGNQQGYWKLADIMFSQGRYEEQFELLQKAIDLEPNLSDSHWYLAIAYKMTGEEVLFQKKFEDIKKRQTELEIGQLNNEAISNFYINQKDKFDIRVYLYQYLIKENPTKYLTDLQEYLKRNPQDPGAIRKLFIVYIQLGEIDKARSLRENNLDFVTEWEKEYSAIMLQNAENNYKEFSE